MQEVQEAQLVRQPTMLDKSPRVQRIMQIQVLLERIIEKQRLRILSTLWENPEAHMYPACIPISLCISFCISFRPTVAYASSNSSVISSSLALTACPASTKTSFTPWGL